MVLNVENGLKIYPSYCFKASPTYNTWVTLTAKSIHALTQPAEFEGKLFHMTFSISDPVLIRFIDEGSRTYFYLNYPIKFVQLTGVIIALERLEHRWIFAIDDSSGEAVNIICACSLPYQRSIRNETSNKILDEEDITLETRRLGTTAAGSFVDLTNFDIGQVVKVKGFINVYRDEKQISLEKMCTSCNAFKTLLHHHGVDSIADHVLDLQTS